MSIGPFRALSATQIARGGPTSVHAVVASKLACSREARLQGNRLFVQGRVFGHISAWPTHWAQKFCPFPRYARSRSDREHLKQGSCRALLTLIVQCRPLALSSIRACRLA